MDEVAVRQFVELEENHFWFIGRRRIFVTLLDEQLAGRGDLEVLDVGCGAGGMIGPLSRYGHVTGLDVSEELLEVCRSRGYDVVQGDAYDLPVNPGSIDLITLFDTIEHIRDDVGVLRECREALRPGGLLFMSGPAYRFLYAQQDRIVHHERRYTAREMRAKLTEAGLAPAKVSYFNTLLFPAILPTVLAKKARERFGVSSGQTNLSHEIPKPVNRALAATMGGERHLLTKVSLPFGHSLIAMARRED
jgi:SAM-dependent methyltransferase